MRHTRPSNAARTKQSLRLAPNPGPESRPAMLGLRLSSLSIGLLLLSGCGAAGPGEAEWPPLAKKWFDRADASFKAGDIEDAESAVDNALHADKVRPAIRVLAARIALARLEYPKVLVLLKGVEGSEASSIRGRALWYSGEVEQAADELERLVADPEVRDG